MKVFKANFTKIAGGLGAMVATGLAHADPSGLGAQVVTAAGESKADIVSAGPAILGIALAVAAVAWLRRIIK